MKNISIIIPIKNGEKKIKSVFAGLESLKLPRGLRLAEVIFVDDGSRDGTFSTLVRVSQNSKLPMAIFTYKKALGLKLATKFGIANSKSKINIIAKPDLSDLPSKLNRLTRKLQKERASIIPTLSVVMHTNNSEKYLKSALSSLLAQTFKKFEIIIVDDASTDTSWQIIQKFAKKSDKIHALQNEKSIGEAKSINRAIKRAQGEYIARMDASDIASKTRFEKQIQYLTTHPKTVAIGAQCRIISTGGRIIGRKTFPIHFDDLYKHIFKFSPLQEPTLMIARRRLPRDFDFYTEGVAPSIDLEFIFKLLKYGKVENTADFLQLSRVNSDKTFTKIRNLYFQMFASRAKGVIYHGYKPDFDGLSITLLQIIAIFVLPIYLLANLIIFRYSRISKSKKIAKSYPIALDTLLPL